MPYDREIPNDALGYVEPDEEDDLPGGDDSAGDTIADRQAEDAAAAT